MKKYSYIVAMACILVAAVGFASIFATTQSQEKNKEVAEGQKQTKDNEAENNAEKEDLFGDQFASAKKESEKKTDAVKPDTTETDTAKADKTEVVTDTKDPEEDTKKDVGKGDAQVANVTEEKLHFDLKGNRRWPVEGAVLLDYSTDATIFFPTLQQYQYHPAMVLAAQVNDKVYFMAKGKITNIETNEVTGCTVTQDLGDGYTAIYGQLKELNFAVGDTVDCGQVVGYVSEPTKYYSVEGSNVYFQILKDGTPVNPNEILK